MGASAGRMVHWGKALWWRDSNATPDVEHVDGSSTHDMDNDPYDDEDTSTSLSHFEFLRQAQLLLKDVTDSRTHRQREHDALNTTDNTTTPLGSSSLLVKRDFDGEETDETAKLQEALAHVDTAIALCPHYALSHYLRGKLWMMLQEWRSAIDAFSEGVALLAGGPEHDLCYLLFALQADCLEELDECEMAVALRAQIPKELRAKVTAQSTQTDTMIPLARKGGAPLTSAGSTHGSTEEEDEVAQNAAAYYKERSQNVYQAIERDYNMRRFQFGRRKVYALKSSQREDIRQRCAKKDRLMALSNSMDGGNSGGYHGL